jgi:hypothetical protein
MTEAVLAGEDVEELPLHNTAAVLAACNALLTGFSENLLVRYRPRDAGNRDREQEEPGCLFAKRFHCTIESWKPELFQGADYAALPARS